jgi:hypothetical protein
MAENRDVIWLYLQYGIYDSPVPATLIRSASSEQSPSPTSVRRRYRLEECLTIVATSEIGDGATGVVLRGTLQVEECRSLDVAIKLALSDEQREALRSEYAIYSKLRMKGVCTGIVTLFGLFEDVEGTCSALVMSYAGEPLSTVSVSGSCRYVLTCLNR